MVWIILLISIFIFLYAVIKLKPPGKILLSALLTGGVITVFNTLCEWFCAKEDIYYVAGPLPLFRTPFPFFLLWIFLTSLYCTGFQFLPSGKKGRALYVFAGIVAGWGFDYIMWKKGVLLLGKGGGPMAIAMVWILAVPLALILFALFKKIVIPSGESGR